MQIDPADEHGGNDGSDNGAAQRIAAEKIGDAHAAQYGMGDTTGEKADTFGDYVAAHHAATNTGQQASQHSMLQETLTGKGLEEVHGGLVSVLDHVHGLAVDLLDHVAGYGGGLVADQGFVETGDSIDVFGNKTHVVRYNDNGGALVKPL